MTRRGTTSSVAGRLMGGLCASLLAAGATSAAWGADSATPAAASAPTKAATAGSKAGTSGPANLFELLDLVQRGLEVEKDANLRRVQEFLQQKDQQKKLLADAKATLARKEEASQHLEETYNGNERAIAENQDRLTKRLGELGELFGVVRQVANEAAGNVMDSLTSSQLGTRQEVLDKLGRSTELPTTDDLEKLWYELQREMTEQGQVVRYPAEVLTDEGLVEQRNVVRAGVFSAVSNGRYLLWQPKEGKLAELTRQPPSRYLDTVEPFEELKAGFGVLAVDPSRGQLLSALTDTPSFKERINQGGYVGYTIIFLGILALVLGVFRWLAVTVTSRRVSAQQRSEGIDTSNPLGRVLQVFEDNRLATAETLELKLDEAVMRETSKLQQFMWVVKTVSVVAPLLGLLGTVTGMIKTFQAITLFGAGDPKMMAGGISEALVTTMLGLMTAIPLVLLYDTLANTARRVIDILDEQSAGLIAARAERDSAAD